MTTPYKQTQQSKTSASSISVEETTEHNLTMPLAGKQHTGRPSPSPHTLPTSTIQPGRTNLELAIIRQHNTTHFTQLDAPMMAPTQLIGKQTPDDPNRMAMKCKNITKNQRTTLESQINKQVVY